MALDLTSEQLDMLRGTVYGGYRTVPVWRDQDDPGPRSEIDFDFYGGTRFEPDDAETNLWAAIAQEVGIKNINSQNDIREMYDYVLGYSGRGNGSNQSQGEPNYTNPTPSNPDPRRGTGDFGDITTVLDEEYDTATKAGTDIAEREVDTIDTPSIDDRLNDIIGSLTLDFENRYSGLEDLLMQQQQNFNSSLTLMQQQAQAAQAAYQQQLMLSQNMAKAYVPPAEQTAATAATGDQRTTQTRQAKDNVLSELSILSGLGTSSSPLSGLQLA